MVKITVYTQSKKSDRDLLKEYFARIYHKNKKSLCVLYPEDSKHPQHIVKYWEDFISKIIIHDELVEINLFTHFTLIANIINNVILKYGGKIKVKAYDLKAIDEKVSIVYKTKIKSLARNAQTGKLIDKSKNFDQIDTTCFPSYWCEQNIVQEFENLKRAIQFSLI